MYPYNFSLTIQASKFKDMEFAVKNILPLEILDNIDLGISKDGQIGWHFKQPRINFQIRSGRRHFQLVKHLIKSMKNLDFGSSGILQIHLEYFPIIVRRTKHSFKAYSSSLLFTRRATNIIKLVENEGGIFKKGFDNGDFEYLKIQNGCLPFERKTVSFKYETKFLRK